MNKITHLNYWIMTFLIVLFLPLAGLTDDWEFYESIKMDSDNQDVSRFVDVEIYFKIEAIESDGKIEYLEKHVCSADACRRMTLAEKEDGRPVKMKIELHAVDCVNNRIKIDWVKFYGTDGTYLSSISKEYGWEDVDLSDKEIFGMDNYICEKYYSR